MTWQMNVNVAGAGVRGPGSGYQEPATGAYKVRVTKAEEYAKDGVVASIRFSTEIDGGDFAGTDVRVYIGTDLNKGGNRTSWRTALLSCGYTPAQIDAGELAVGPTTFEGKTAYIYNKARDPNDPTSQSDRRFITEEAFKSLMGETVTAAAPAAAKATVPSVSVAAKPAAAGGLRAMLGK